MHCFLIPSVFLCTVSAAASQDVSALNAWLERQASVKTLAVSFTQERTLPSLKEPVTSAGKLIFSQPDKMRWELGDPPVTMAVSDGATFTIIDFKKKQARRLPVDSPQASRFSLLTRDGFQSPEKFHATFKVSGHRFVSGIHQYTLQPNDRKLRAQMPWVFLDIEPGKNELRALAMELKDKSRIRTVFHAPVFNAPVPAGTFQPALEGISVR